MSERGVGTAPYGLESKGNRPWVALFYFNHFIIFSIFHISDDFLPYY